MSDVRGAPGMGGCLTGDIPGIGGRIKERAEDFLVEEQPLYEPCGEGEHIYLLVQKRGLATSSAVSIIADHFGVRRGSVGYAGLKDKRAITRQVVSVHTPGKKPEDFPQLERDDLVILWTDLHTNKLRVGHLTGNRFSIKVRGVDMSAAVSAERTLRRLAESGVPNLAGEQRFGTRQNNHLIGRADLLGDAQGALDLLLGPDPEYPESMPESRALYEAGDYAAAVEVCPRMLRVERQALGALSRGASAAGAMKAIDGTQRRFWASAFQSAVFNRVLTGRIEAGAFDRLMLGDLAQKHRSGAVFQVDESVLAEPDIGERVRTFDVSPSGPLWGPRMARAGGVVDEVECAALAETGVTVEDIEAFGKRSRQEITGARRPLRVPVIDPEVEGGIDEHGHYVRCAFELPRGAYATVVMREVMKAGVDDADDEGEDDGATR